MCERVVARTLVLVLNCPVEPDNYYTLTKTPVLFELRPSSAPSFLYPKTNNVLKLPDGSPLTILLHSEAENRESIDNADSFRINSYMNFVSSSRFGKLLIYTPRLASTHDVVSK